MNLSEEELKNSESITNQGILLAEKIISEDKPKIKQQTMITKIDLRESLNIPNSETTTPIEIFQNQTLRPILKLQNDLYLLLYTNYAFRQKPDFNSLSVSKRQMFIEQSLQKDTVLKNTFIGMMIGMFTLEELEIYNSESKEFNKRIITMLIERLKSQIK